MITAKAFKNDLLPMIMSLAVAVGIWYFISIGEWDERIVFNVPVSITPPPENLVISHEIPHSFKIVLRGSKDIVDKLRSDMIQLRIDLSRATIGTNDIPLHMETEQLSSRIRIEKAPPKSITVIIEPYKMVTVPILASVIGEPETDYMVKDIVIKPSKTTIGGPLSMITNLDFVYTEPVNIEGVEGTMNRSVQLQLKPPLTICSNTDIQITVNIDEDIRILVFNSVPVDITPPAGYTVVSPPSTLTARVRVKVIRSALSDVTVDTITAFAVFPENLEGPARGFNVTVPIYATCSVKNTELRILDNRELTLTIKRQ